MIRQDEFYFLPASENSLNLRCQYALLIQIDKNLFGILSLAEENSSVLKYRQKAVLKSKNLYQTALQLPHHIRTPLPHIQLHQA